jgi:hypothetical protein
MSRLIALLLLLAAALAPQVTRAESAKELLRQGNRLFADGEYEEARKLFQRAYEKDQRPVFLRSLAHCLVKLRWHPDALARFKEYQRRFPRARDRQEIERMIKQLDIVVNTRLTVRSRPLGASIHIDSEAARPVGVTPKVVTVEPGERVVILVKEGYRPVRRTIQIKPRQRQELRIPLEVPLAVTSTPPGAAVHLDGEDGPFIGKTPLEGGVPVGRRTLLVKLSGYSPHRQTVEVRGGKAVSVQVTLKIPVTLRSVPAGARVLVDGKQLEGKAPLDAALPAGKHRVEMRLDGFKPWRDVVEIVPGEKKTLTGRLGGSALLSIRTVPQGAKLSVGKLELGTTPLTDVGLPSGERRLVLTHPDRRDWSQVLQVRKGDRFKARVELGRASWPFWVLVGATGLAAVLGTIVGVAALDRSHEVNNMLVEERDASGRPTGRLAVGACTNDGPVFDRMWDAKNGRVANDACGQGLEHAATGFLTTAGVTAVGAMLYYWFVMRPREQIQRVH